MGCLVMLQDRKDCPERVKRVIKQSRAHPELCHGKDVRDAFRAVEDWLREKDADYKKVKRQLAARERTIRELRKEEAEFEYDLGRGREKPIW